MANPPPATISVAFRTQKGQQVPPDIPDFDEETVIRHRTSHDGPAGYCPAHVDISREIAETHALVQSREPRFNNIETKQDITHELVACIREDIAGLRMEMKYHSKFWGAIGGAVVAAFWWLVSGLRG